MKRGLHDSDPLERCTLKDDEQEQESQALIPSEQQTITFRNKPLVVVRLPEVQGERFFRAIGPHKVAGHTLTRGSESS